jgi:hypothetical protein
MSVSQNRIAHLQLTSMTWPAACGLGEALPLFEMGTLCRTRALQLAAARAFKSAVRPLGEREN